MARDFTGDNKELAYKVDLDLSGAEQALRDFQLRTTQLNQGIGMPSIPGMPSGVAPVAGAQNVFGDATFAAVAQAFQTQARTEAEKAVQGYLTSAGAATPFGFTPTERFLTNSMPTLIGTAASIAGGIALGPLAPIMGFGAMAGSALGYAAGTSLSEGIPGAITSHLATRHLIREDELSGRINPMSMEERSDVATGIRRAAQYYDLDMETTLRAWNQASDSSSIFKNASPDEIKENSAKLIRQWKAMSLVMYDSLDEVGRAVEEMEQRKMLTRDPSQMVQLASMARLASSITGTPLPQVLNTTQAMTQQFSYGTSQAPGEVAAGILPYYTMWQETYQNMGSKDKELVKNLGGSDLLFGMYSAATRNYLTNTPEGAAMLYAGTLAQGAGTDLRGGLQLLGPAFQTMTPYEQLSFQGEAGERFAAMTPGEQARMLVNMAQTTIDPNLAPRTQDAVALLLQQKMGLGYAQSKAMSELLTPLATEEGKYQELWMDLRASGVAKHAAMAVDANAGSFGNWLRTTFSGESIFGGAATGLADWIAPDTTSFTWQSKHGADKSMLVGGLSSRVFGSSSGSLSNSVLSGARGIRHAGIALEQYSGALIHGEEDIDTIKESMRSELAANDVPEDVVNMLMTDLNNIASLADPRQRQMEVSKLIKSYRQREGAVKQSAIEADDRRVQTINNTTATALSPVSDMLASGTTDLTQLTKALEQAKSGLGDSAAARRAVDAVIEHASNVNKGGTAEEKERAVQDIRNLVNPSAQDPMAYTHAMGLAEQVAALSHTSGVLSHSGLSQTGIDRSTVEDMVKQIEASSSAPRMQDQLAVLHQALKTQTGDHISFSTAQQQELSSIRTRMKETGTTAELTATERVQQAALGAALAQNEALFKTDMAKATDTVIASLKATGAFTDAELADQREALSNLRKTALQSDNYNAALVAGVHGMRDAAFDLSQGKTAKSDVASKVLYNAVADATRQDAGSYWGAGSMFSTPDAMGRLGSALELVGSFGDDKNIGAVMKEIDEQIGNKNLSEAERTKLKTMKEKITNLASMSPADREKAKQEIANTLFTDLSETTQNELFEAKYGSSFTKRKQDITLVRSMAKEAQAQGASIGDIIAEVGRTSKVGSLGSKLLEARGVEDLDFNYQGKSYHVDLDKTSMGDPDALIELARHKGFMTPESQHKFIESLQNAHQARVQQELAAPDVQAMMKKRGISLEDAMRDPEEFLGMLGRTEQSKNPMSDYSKGADKVEDAIKTHEAMMGKLCNMLNNEVSTMRASLGGQKY